MMANDELWSFIGWRTCVPHQDTTSIQNLNLRVLAVHSYILTSTGEIYSLMMLQGDQVVCDDEFHTEDADEVGTGKNIPTTLV